MSCLDCRTINKAQDMTDAYDRIEKKIRDLITDIHEIKDEGLGDLVICLEDGLSDVKTAREKYDRILERAEREEKEWLTNQSYKW